MIDRLVSPMNVSKPATRRIHQGAFFPASESTIASPPRNLFLEWSSCSRALGQKTPLTALEKALNMGEFIVPIYMLDVLL